MFLLGFVHSPTGARAVRCIVLKESPKQSRELATEGLEERFARTCEFG